MDKLKDELMQFSMQHNYGGTCPMNSSIADILHKQIRLILIDKQISME